MVEQRRNPRIWVSWRCGIRLPDGRLLLCRAQNISIEGLALVSDEMLHKGRSYPMMIEIPGINDPRSIHRVSCTGEIRHVILSEGAYRAGIQLSAMSELHAELVRAWMAKADKQIA
ncbi:PilZ domain-containing protein [Undibacterium luofuense]|uniref:PilZ domain-containing protein n=1 Tax=Undibacterium luofuense TaxID=2828733 RepID=A0A941DN19_9BURK|nr:PilZ domain-containing protein [Undibacterium luofuense]MBR7782910.1 PilZ domain-containing protein [Undibacterium luofuense]